MWYKMDHGNIRTYCLGGLTKKKTELRFTSERTYFVRIWVKEVEKIIEVEEIYILKKTGQQQETIITQWKF
jgi:hypothetical protein